MSRRGRRWCASPSVALGWPHIVAFTRFGFASRVGVAGQLIPTIFRREPRIRYASPAIGLRVGAPGGVIRVLLDRRDLRQALLETQPGPPPPAAARRPSGAPATGTRSASRISRDGGRSPHGGPAPDGRHSPRAPPTSQRLYTQAAHARAPTAPRRRETVSLYPRRSVPVDSRSGRGVRCGPFWEDTGRGGLPPG